MTIQGRGFSVQLKKFRIYWPTENTQQGLYALFPIRRNRTLVQANLTLYAKECELLLVRLHIGYIVLTCNLVEINLK